MSFTATTNIITILFCLGVLVQSVRMMRSLKQVREGQLNQTVAALDAATSQACSVLAGLRATLSSDGAASLRSLAEAKQIRDELNIIIGIANAMAERLVEAASVKPQDDGSTAGQEDAATLDLMRPAKGRSVTRGPARPRSTKKATAAKPSTVAAGAPVEATSKLEAKSVEAA